MFNVENQQPGDILLIKNKKSILNVIFQALGSCKKVSHSHAILCLGSGIFIEAMKYNGDSQDKFGIDILCIEELQERFKYQYENNWKVVRNNELSIECKNKLVQRAIFYYGQKYNKNFVVGTINNKKLWNASYCSELISRIYMDIGFSIRNGNVWPVHLSILPNTNSSWEDVTADYKIGKNTPDDIFGDEDFNSFLSVFS